MTAAYLAIQLLLMVGIGIFIGRIGVVQGDFDRQLTAFVLKLCLPCMIIQSMMGTFSLEELKNCGRLIIISIVTWAITFALGQLVYHLTGKTASGRIMRFSMIYTNFTFMGIPVMEALFGDQGVFYLVVFLVPYRMIYYSSAEAMLSPPGLARTKPTFVARLKGWFSPPVVAVFIGLFFYITQIPLPVPIKGVLSGLGSCASPLGMVLCGLSLSKYNFKQLLRPRYLLVPLVRNLLLPALTLGVVLLLGLDPQLAQIVVIFAALPTASLLAAFTIQYDPDKDHQFEAAAAVFFTTLFAAFTIPLWSLILSFSFP